MRIRLKSYNKLALAKYIEVLTLTFSFVPTLRFSFAASLPTKVRRFTVNKSPHIDKKSRDQFEMRTYTKLLSVTGEFNLVLSKLFAVELTDGVYMELMPILSADDSRWLVHGAD